MKLIMNIAEESCDSLSKIEIKHRKEKKELQAQIQALKKTAKNDKTKKKELLSEISKLEIEMESRHKQELELLQNVTSPVNDSGSENQALEHEVTKIKISKAQKRRDKRSLMDKQREEQIKLQEKENASGPRNIEIQEISAKLKKRCLKIFTIPSDGDCLYKAIAHQLELTQQQSFSAQRLRLDVANYMRQNKDDFLPFMTNPDNHEMLTDEQFQHYCDKIAKTNMWGGQLEIKALSSSLKCPINIIQATGPECLEQGTEFPNPPLVITYHRHMYRLGEHYNSTCVDEEDSDQ